MQLKKMWYVLVVLALVLMAGQPVLAAGDRPDPAPLLATDSPTAIPDRYIVVFRDDVDMGRVLESIDRLQKFGIEVHYVYTDALHGFAATLPATALATVRMEAGVSFVEADQVVTLDTTQTNPPSWGLDRIDQRALPLNSAFSYNSTGSGVTAYVIDTGILASHNEFGGRASIGKDTVGDGKNGVDCNGHGTHVAGTIGGSSYGVAKNVTIVAVRVLNCSGSGSNSGVAAGIDWVTSNHQTGQPAVANMSLGGSKNNTIDTAVNNSIADGVTYAVAAGNEGGNACRKSPANVPNAITVGATDSSDTKASWSNFGICLDIFAPGVSITSAWIGSNTAANTISGTSMASPHVAGVAALYLGTNQSATPQQVRDAMVNNATSNAVKSPGKNSPNKLLFTSY